VHLHGAGLDVRHASVRCHHIPLSFAPCRRSGAPCTVPTRGEGVERPGTVAVFTRTHTSGRFRHSTESDTHASRDVEVTTWRKGTTTGIRRCFASTTQPVLAFLLTGRDVAFRSGLTGVGA
jgi:hypothetical protein